MLLLKMVVISLVLSASSRTRRPNIMMLANALSTHQHHNRRCTSLSSSSTTSSDNDTKIAKQIKKKEKTAAIKAGREKRAKFIGLAKAVDRGQFQNTYNPAGQDGFTAKSGLPNLEKSFCVLGIESSCDDTGGEFRCMIGFKYMMCLSLF